MDFSELEKKAEIIETNINKKKPEFNTFKTEPGLKFQQEFSDIMNLMKQGNFFQLALNFLSWGFEEIINPIIDNLDIDQDEELEIKSTKENCKIDFKF